MNVRANHLSWTDTADTICDFLLISLGSLSPAVKYALLNVSSN